MGVCGCECVCVCGYVFFISVAFPVVIAEGVPAFVAGLCVYVCVCVCVCVCFSVCV
jgi:hypothetical protein